MVFSQREGRQPSMTARSQARLKSASGTAARPSKGELTSHMARSPVGVGGHLGGAAMLAVSKDGGGEEANAGGDGDPHLDVAAASAWGVEEAECSTRRCTV